MLAHHPNGEHMKSGKNWRKRAVEACAVIGDVVRTVAGDPHAVTVSRMVEDPQFRAEAILLAVRLTTNGVGLGRTEPDALQRVQNAADILRGYEGRPI